MQKIEEFVLCESVSFPLTERNIAAVMTMFVIEFQTKRQTFLRWQDSGQRQRGQRMNVSECPSCVLHTPLYSHSILHPQISFNEWWDLSQFSPCSHAHPRSKFLLFHENHVFWAVVHKSTRRSEVCICFVFDWPKWGSRSASPVRALITYRWIWGFWAKFYDELNLMFDLFLVLHNGGGADINKLQ